MILKSSPRVRIIETSSAAAEVSFGHIRDGEVSDADGKEIRNPTPNPGPRRRVHQRQRTRPRDLGGHPDPHGRTLWEGLNAAFDLGAGQDFARSLGLTNPRRHFSRPVTPPALEAPPAPPPPSPPAQDPVTTRFSFYPGDPTNEIDFLPPQQFPQCGVQGNELSCGAAPGYSPARPRPAASARARRRPRVRAGRSSSPTVSRRSRTSGSRPSLRTSSRKSKTSSADRSTSTSFSTVISCVADPQAGTAPSCCISPSAS
jgi:hypothetical protein